MKSKGQLLSLNRAISFLGIGSLILAIAIALLAGSATGYEISIYNAYPIYFWFSIITSLLSGILILVDQAFSKEKSYWWIVGLSIVALTNLFVLVLPVFRGYASWSATDTLTHLGRVNDIFYSGHLPAPGSSGENYYPATHILATAICYATGIKPELLVMILPAFFFLFYVLSIFVFSKHLTKNLGKAILITTFGSLLLFEVYQVSFLPSTFAFFLIPFILYLFFRSRKLGSRNWICLTLVLFMLPMYHPGEVPLFLLLIFVCIDIALPISKWKNKVKTSEKVDNTYNLKFSWKFYPIVILLGAVFIWFSSFNRFSYQISTISKWLFAGIGRESIAPTLGLLQRANLSPIQFADLFTKMYGQMIIYFSISIVLGIIVLKKFLFSREKTDTNQFAFVFLFLIFGISIFIFAFNDFFLSYDRELRWVIFASTVVNGIGLFELYSQARGKNVKRVIKGIIIILLSTAVVISLFNTFNSPILKTYNNQVTTSDISGMFFFFANQDNETRTIDVFTGSYRFAHLYFGVAETPENIGISDVLPLDHFGYSKYPTLGQSYTNDKYLMEDTLSRIIYPQTAPNYVSQWRFTASDFNRLENDLSVNLLYSNGDLRIYRIKGTEK